MSIPLIRWPYAMPALAVVAIVVAARLVRLDTLPGEWYGDISTLHEYAAAIRNGDFPPTLYVLGVGPLHPSIAAVLLPGDAGYLAYKLLGVALSLLGLAALFGLARRLHPDRVFAWLAVLVAGTGTWLLALSRLGDQHPLPFLLSAAATLLAVSLVQTRERASWRAIGCGILAGAGLYAYGATFALPAVVATIVLAGWSKGRVSTATALRFAFALTIVVAPLAWIVVARWAEIRHGHFGKAAATSLADIATNAVRGLGAFFTTGDANARVIPQSRPHLDPLSAIAMLAGAVWWLKPGRRAAGALVLGAFVAFLLPSLLASPTAVPSAGRTVAAAPFAYLLVAGGLWWGYEAASRRLAPATAALGLTAALAAIVAINLHRYFVDYADGLPWQNTEVARPIARHLATLPPGTHAYLVDTGWGPSDVPEIKSIRFNAARGAAIDEIGSRDLDCARFAALERPGEIVWRPSLPLPSAKLCECAGALRSGIHRSPGGQPIFRSAALPPRDAAPVACSAETAAAVAGATTERPVSIEATVATADGAVRIRHSPLDMGKPADILDGNETTLMRGAQDNPFRFEVALARPTRVASVTLVLGYMPHYVVEVTVVDANGREHAASGAFDGVPGVAPRPQLALAAPVEQAREIRVSIADRRPAPPGGFHVHVFEMVVR